MTATAGRQPQPTSVDATTSVRVAGLADVPAIARLATDSGDGPEPAAVSRARRFLLTHVAFEHGMLWVAHDLHGAVTAAVAVIPGDPHAITRPVINGILRAFEDTSGWDPVREDRDDLLETIASVGAAWVISPIGGVARGQVSGAPDLLRAAVVWAADRSAGSPVAVLADSTEDRRRAEQLRFVEHPGPRLRSRWWFGVRSTDALVPDGSTSHPGRKSRHG